MENPLVLDKPELNISVTFGQNPIPVVNGMVEADVVLEITPIIPNQDSHPLDMCVVVDCSGSMSHQASRSSNITKIKAVRDGLMSVVHKMAPKDRIRVIGFSDKAFEVLPWTTIEHTKLESVVDQLNKELYPRGCTHFKDALNMAFENGLGDHGSPSLVLLTDGQSSSPHEDHPFMVQFTDKLREKKIPLIIYGTGPDYNKNLLDQLAIRAGNGSLMYHVLSVEALDAHLTSELAFRHGFCLEHVKISVFHALATFWDVYRFIPQEHQLLERNPHNPEQNDADCYVLRHGKGFQNACGFVDHLRGQKFLFRISVPVTDFQEASLFNVEISGNKPGEPPFKHIIPISAFSTLEPSTQEDHPEVTKYKLMVEATKALKEKRYEDGAQIYERMGRPDLAQTMNLLAHAGEDEESTARSMGSFASSVASVVLTQLEVDEILKRGKKS
ncbi:hypothetical protein A2318_01975 [Candidatus Uhrbacteria bacterium RIFOXYB2_FULL_45_11]|uniref:VWFA domain-containing protein n=1 Tax=Candidatus Uhrbacteria bacterium RIFOXYB2_FULL_45_11 TaxID=1802421 RepID=A0A1F7W5B4_9BACT|nr:MAG: hypothetical protein A2318_01975 [Candidatus Uhrbacteria bacterium RIFOXYB2_FULL_45_11]